MPESMIGAFVTWRSSRRALFLSVVAPACAILLGACQKQASQEAAPIRPVRTEVVKITEWSASGSAIGEIKPRFESDLGFRIAGKIAARALDVGAVVEKGTVIARLDDTTEQTALRIAQTDVEAAQAELSDASADEARKKQLLQGGVTTQAIYDDAQRRLKLAQTKLDAAKLAKDNAQEQLGYTVLAADEHGLVTAVGAEVGQVVAAGQMVVRVARTDAKEAEFNVAEQTLSSVPKDSLVEVSLLSDPDIKTTGHVREVATTADPVTRTFAVRVALVDPPDSMRFGATVEGRVVLKESKVVELPSSALFSGENGPAVWVFDAASTEVKLRPVTVLRYEADKVLITDGLAEGERVVTAGVQKLFPGMKVRLQ